MGGSIGLDRLLAALEELKKVPNPKTMMVFIAIATQDATGAAHQLAANLRSHGIRTDVGLTTGKIGNQFKHADRLGAQWVIVLGTDEITNKTFTLKNMQSGEETKGHPLHEAPSL